MSGNKRVAVGVGGVLGTGVLFSLERLRAIAAHFRLGMRIIRCML